MRDSVFAVVTYQSCTGFVTADLDRWPDLCRFVVMGLAAVGGCSGSTAGGLKVVRFLIACRATLLLIRRFTRPRAVLQVQVDGAGVDDAALFEVLSHVVLWGLVIGAMAVTLTAFGIDIVSATSAVVACISNVGPGLGRVGPATDYGGLPEVVKFLLALVMILGRLEFYAVVALLIPGFWRR
jgi:trk system potassium uptake protein TrkH